MRLLVDRCPDQDEATPDCWAWADMLGGGDPVVMSVTLVGTTVEPIAPTTEETP